MATDSVLAPKGALFLLKIINHDDSTRM